MNSLILELVSRGTSTEVVESDEQWMTVSDDCGIETRACYTVERYEAQEEEGHGEHITDDGLTVTLVKIEHIISGCGKTVEAKDLHPKAVRHIEYLIKDNL